MKLNNFSDLAPELIVWEDISQCQETWATESELETWLSDVADSHVEQVGFVIGEDEKNLVVTDGFIESIQMYGNVHKIPKSVIIKRVKLYEAGNNLL